MATIVVIFGVMIVLFASNTPTPTAGASAPGLAPQPRPPKGTEVVYVGIEPIQVYSVSLESNTYQTSFYIWWRWRGSINPCPTTDILNSTDSSNNFVIEYAYLNAAGRETPTILPDGAHYQSAKISVGVSDPFSVSRYPLDEQTLTVRIENNNYPFDQVDYVPDTGSMSRTPSLTVAGWSLKSTAIASYLHTYGTDFGEPSQGVSNDQYSQLTYSIVIQRPFSHFLMKLFLPMFVVLMAGLSALFVKANDFDVRLAMAGTGLLTLIFLQQGYAGDLPSTAPVVLMDEIYALAYAAVGLTFARVVYTTVRVHHHTRTVDSFILFDRVIAVALAAAFLIGTTILVAA